jgi:hypothetical protein
MMWLSKGAYFRSFTAAAEIVLACFHPLQMLPTQGIIVRLAGHAVVCRLQSLHLLRHGVVGAATAAVLLQCCCFSQQFMHVSQPFYHGCAATAQQRFLATAMRACWLVVARFGVCLP